MIRFNGNRAGGRVFSVACRYTSGTHQSVGAVRSTHCIVQRVVGGRVWEDVVQRADVGQHRLLVRLRGVHVWKRTAARSDTSGQ